MNRLLRALEVRYQAEVEEALAVLDLYFARSVGVGDHSNVVDELDAALSKLDNAKSKLATLSQLVQPEGESPLPTEDKPAV